MKLRRQKGINYSIAGRMKSYGHKATFETVLRGVSPVAPEKLLRKKKKQVISSEVTLFFLGFEIVFYMGEKFIIILR